VGQTHGEEALLRELPMALQLELAVMLNRSLFTKVPLFQQADAECILFIVQRIRSSLFLPGATVVREGDPAKGVHVCQV